MDANEILKSLVANGGWSALAIFLVWWIVSHYTKRLDTICEKIVSIENLLVANMTSLQKTNRAVLRSQMVIKYIIFALNDLSISDNDKLKSIKEQLKEFADEQYE